MCRWSRTVLRPATADPRSGALSRRVVSKARCAGRIETAGTETASGIVARELRSYLARADRTSRQAERHQADDRTAEAVAETWPCAAAGSDRVGAGGELLRCGRGP